MARAFALTQQLPFATPSTHVGRRLERAAKNSWAVAFLMLTAVLGGYYVYQMNITASKGYTLRELDKRREQLRTTVGVLEARGAQMRALRTIEDRVQGLGYVSVDKMEFVDVAGGSYALAR